MSSRAIWMIGPLLGVALLSAAIAVPFGPGFFMLAIYGAAGFAFGVPMVQVVLSQVRVFRGHNLASCVIGVVIVVLGIVGGILSGKFFYW